MNYHVEFEYDGRTIEKVFEDCHDAGNAFRKCLKKYKGCRLIRAYCQSKITNCREWFQLTYQPPSANGVVPEPNIKMLQDEMELGDPRLPKHNRGRPRGSSRGRRGT